MSIRIQFADPLPRKGKTIFSFIILILAAVLIGVAFYLFQTYLEGQDRNLIWIVATIAAALIAFNFSLKNRP